MSFSTVSCGCFFGKGMTVADFHSLGSTPSLSELLKIAVTGAARRCEQSFNTHGGMFSGPVALLTLTFSSATSVSITLIMNSTGNGSSASKIGREDCNLGKSSHTDTKNPFIELTRLSKSPSVYLLAPASHCGCQMMFPRGASCVSTSHVSMILRVLRFLIGHGGAILALYDSLSSSVFWPVSCHQTDQVPEAICDPWFICAMT